MMENTQRRLQTGAFVVLLLFAAVLTTASAQTTNDAAAASDIYMDTAKARNLGEAAAVLTDLGSPYTQVGENSAGTVALLANLPFIAEVQVRPDTRDVIISFTSTQKTPPLIEIGKVAPAADQQGILAFPADSGAFSRFVPGQNGTYSLNLGTLGEQLDIGSRYYYIINVFNDDKNNPRRPREQVTGKFTTLPQTVKVIFTEIRILPVFLSPLTALNGSDYVFVFDVNGPDADKLARLYDAWTLKNWGRSGEFQVPGRRGLGTAAKPIQLSLGANHIQEEMVIEYAPDDLQIAVTGEVPNLERYNNKYGYGYRNGARGGFDLSAYPGDSVSIPFSLSSVPLERGGRMAFEIKGRIEVTRHSLTAPEPRYQALGRVKLPPTGAPPRSLCDAARSARARNSPAAPGLEAQCRAQGGTL